MSIRLSYRMGPVRVSVPLTSGSTRRRGKTWHAIARFPDGSEYKCHHVHRTQQAASECADKYIRDRKAGKSVPPLTKKPRMKRLAPPPAAPKPLLPNPAAYMQEGMALLQGLAAVNSPESAQALVYHANMRVRTLTANNPSHIAQFFNTFREAAANQGRVEIDDCMRAADRATSQVQVTAARARMDLVNLRNETVGNLAVALGLRLR